MYEEVIQWLKDGGDIEAADILQQCKLQLAFVDLLFELGGEREFELYDAELLAPRNILDSYEGSVKDEITKIENAIRELAHSFHWHIRNVVWAPAPPIVRSTIEEELNSLLSDIDAVNVNRIWNKAIERRQTDPDGSITAAKTMLESICKFILDKKGVEYSSRDDLPKLYFLTSRSLTLAPDQQEEEMVRNAMGNAQAVVSSIAAIRNLSGDAHGSGMSTSIPSAELAAFVVNLSGSIASFLIMIWQESNDNAP